MLVHGKAEDRMLCGHPAWKWVERYEAMAIEGLSKRSLGNVWVIITSLLLDWLSKHPKTS